MTRRRLLHALPVLLGACGPMPRSATSQPATSQRLVEAMRQAHAAHGGLVWEAALEPSAAWTELLFDNGSRRVTVAATGRVSAEPMEPVEPNEAAEARLVRAARVGAIDAVVAAESATGSRAIRIEVDDEDRAWEVRLAGAAGQTVVQVDMASGRVSREG